MSLPRPLEQMFEEACRDDWHMIYVGSDIRQLIGEIERLREEVVTQKQNVKYRDDIIGLSPGGDRHADLVTKIERLQNRNRRLRELLSQWVAGVDCGASIPKNQLMGLLKEELAAQAAAQAAESE